MANALKEIEHAQRLCDHGDITIGEYFDLVKKWEDAEPIVRCKDCLYYEPNNSNCECQRLWGGMIDCKPDSYCSDGITKEEYKRKMSMTVNGLMDEVE